MRGYLVGFLDLVSVLRVCIRFSKSYALRGCLGAIYPEKAGALIIPGHCKLSRGMEKKMLEAAASFSLVSDFLLLYFILPVFSASRFTP